MAKIVFLCLLIIGFSAQAQSIGTAILVQGDASIAPNSQLTVGQTISTSGNGYVFLRTKDGSLLIVRPNSSITIEDYDYRPNQPSENRMRYKLNYGVVRSISGEGLEANKSAYRMNTPMAAIGIRGTDFVVSASQNETLVSLNVGSVIVAPFSDQCLATSLGACAVGATTLDISSADSIAQVVAGSKSAILVKPSAGSGQMPDARTPPSNLEPEKGSQLIKLDRSLVAESLADAVVLDRTNQLVKALEVKSGIPDPVVTAPGLLPEKPIEFKSTLVWGEGSQLPSTLVQLVTGNSDYALYRSERADLTRETGKVDFTMTASRVNYGEIKDAKLSIDFAERRFATQLEHQHQQVTTQLKAVGDITQDGRLFSDWKQGTNMSVIGAIGGSANQEAAYLFKHQPSVQAVNPISGMVHWQRP